jgi:hypothetical protein
MRSYVTNNPRIHELLLHQRRLLGTVRSSVQMETSMQLMLFGLARIEEDMNLLVASKTITEEQGSLGHLIHLLRAAHGELVVRNRALIERAALVETEAEKELERLDKKETERKVTPHAGITYSPEAMGAAITPHTPMAAPASEPLMQAEAPPRVIVIPEDLLHQAMEEAREAMRANQEEQEEQE